MNKIQNKAISVIASETKQSKLPVGRLNRSPRFARDDVRIGLFRISIFEFRVSRKAFTLVEVLLYIAILALLLLAVGSSTQAFLEARVKNQTIAEVDNSGAIAMNMILQATRNADDIASVSTDGSSWKIELDMPATPSGKDPTCFRLSSQKIQIQEGSASCGGTWVDITNSDKVTVALVSGDTEIFKNLSRTLTPGIIRVKFNVAHYYPPGASKYFNTYAKDFQGAAALR